jgi:hypothetical protein
LENEILREALDLAQQKTAVARALTLARRHALKTIADALRCRPLEPDRPGKRCLARSPSRASGKNRN